MEDTRVNEDFWYNFDKILNQTLVPRFSDALIRPCTEKDFQNFKKTLIDNLYTIISLLDIIKNAYYYTSFKKVLLKVIVIIGEQHIKSAWNTNEIVEFSKLLSFKICKVFKSETLTEILKDDDIFLKIIMILRPKLLKDTWKCFPASIICYKWLLELVEKPLLKRHVPEILPTSLIILDDYVQENQVLGLRCISLIIEHCHQSRSLKSFNYDEVIFQTLQKMAQNVQSNMITSLYSCISSLLENIQYCGTKNSVFGWTKHDEILAILLDNMELQTNSQYQSSYIISLSGLLTHSSSGKWSERLTRILSEYCENDINLNIIDTTLDLIKTFLSIYQPRALNFYTIMYGSLLKLHYKLILFEKETKEVTAKVNECISLLSRICPNLGREIIENDKIQSIMNVT